MVDCLPGCPQAWDSNCVLSSTGAPHFLPKRPYLKPTKPAHRRLASRQSLFQPPISNRLTPRLGLWVRANASISHFCCQLSFIVAPSQSSIVLKVHYLEPRRRNWIVAIRIPFLPTIMTAHLLKFICLALQRAC